MQYFFWKILENLCSNICAWLFFLKKFRLLDEISFIMEYHQVTISSKYTFLKSSWENFLKIPKKTLMKNFCFNSVAASRPLTTISLALISGLCLSSSCATSVLQFCAASWRCAWLWLFLLLISELRLRNSCAISLLLCHAVRWGDVSMWLFLTSICELPSRKICATSCLLCYTAK